MSIAVFYFFVTFSEKNAHIGHFLHLRVAIFVSPAARPRGARGSTHSPPAKVRYGSR